MTDQPAADTDRPVAPRTGVIRDMLDGLDSDFAAAQQRIAELMQQRAQLDATLVADDDETPTAAGQPAKYLQMEAKEARIRTDQREGRGVRVPRWP